MEVVGQVLADSGDFGHMSGWGWGWMFFMVLFWAALIGLVAWIAVRNSGPASVKVDPDAVLAHRFALGEISAEEFVERRAALRQFMDPTAPRAVRKKTP
jgi:uncharacterized membrane protein